LANLLNSASSTWNNTSALVSASSSDWTTAFNIVNASSTFWDQAYSWGDHSTEGYLTTIATTTVRGMFSNTVTGLSYNSSTGVTSLTGGYVIPLSASTSEWATAYGWGDHSAEGYLTTESDPIFSGSAAFGIS